MGRDATTPAFSIRWWGPAVAALVLLGLWMTTGSGSAQTEDAAAVYDAQCAACHGAAGEGGAAPSLQASTATLDDISAVIADGAPGMPGFASSLDAAAIEALSGYVLDLQGAATAPGTTVPPTTGSGVYAAQCAGCHGSSGEGAVASSLRSLPYSPDDIAAIVRNGVEGMPAFADQLSADQVTAVAAFVFDLPAGPVTPTTAPPAGVESAAAYSSHCAACHGTDGGGGVGPALVGTSLDASEIFGIAKDGAIHGSVAEVDETQLEAAAEYIVSLGAVAPPAAGPGSGAEVYAQACAACHGADGTGGVAMAVTGSLLDDATLTDIVANGRGAMPGLASSLSPEQIAAVVAYVGELRGDGEDVGSSTTAGSAAAPEVDVSTGPSFWGPLLSTLATFVGVTGLLVFNRRRERKEAGG